MNKQTNSEQRGEEVDNNLFSQIIEETHADSIEYDTETEAFSYNKFLKINPGLCIRFYFLQLRFYLIIFHSQENHQ